MFFGYELFSPAAQFYIQLAVLLFMIYLGIRRGGVALGLIGGLGVLVMYTVFSATPGKPPIDVMLLILAVVLASSTLQAAGGMDYLVQIAEKILRKHPKYVSVIAPFVTYIFTMLIGTGHGIYALQPVIFDVAYKTGVRPERAMAGSAITSQMGITASPISAGVVNLVKEMAKLPDAYHITFTQILMITIPATFIGVCVVALYSYNRGKELNEDPEFQARLQDPEFRVELESSSTSLLGESISKQAKVSVALFLMAIVVIVILAILGEKYILHEVPYPVKDKPPVYAFPKIDIVLQFVMLTCGAIILFYTKVKPKKISDSTVFNAGMIALVTIYGIAWMSDTFIVTNEAYIKETVGDMVRYAPWTFAIAMFVVSAFLKSQAATLVVMMPLGAKLQIPLETLMGCIPACYAYFFFCFYPSDLAAINFDRTGTTRIGKYLLNHSFMIPGLLGVWTAVIVALVLAKVLI